VPIVRALFAESNPMPVKTAVGWLGFDIGPLRAPLCALDEATGANLRREMKTAGLLEKETRAVV
jgi:4-hydroxy-tetrahydrodipicolinate synthase